MALKNYVHTTSKTVTEYKLCFDDGKNNGYAFPCDAEGNLNPDLSECAIKNYNYCIAHPEEFARWNEVIATERVCRIPAHGTCKCGEEIWLESQYLGACQCPNCGKWYNLFGQELTAPEYWEEDYDY